MDLSSLEIKALTSLYHGELFSAHPFRAWCAQITTKMAYRVTESETNSATFTTEMAELTPEQVEKAKSMGWSPELMLYMFAYDLVHGKMRVRYLGFEGKFEKFRIAAVKRDGRIELAW